MSVSPESERPEPVAGDALPGTELLATVTRSGAVEAWHHGAVVVVEAGAVVQAVGDPDSQVFCRSATKPLQALPLLEHRSFDSLNLDERHLALLSASHDSTPSHVEVAAELLEKGGYAAEDLLCGPHSPFDRKSGFAIAAAGERPGRLHNNCSGKHAGFLLLARLLGEDPGRYLETSSQVQTQVREVVGQMCDLRDPEITVGMDGCGAPTFRMPLVALAKGFARLTNPEGLTTVRTQACSRLLSAISNQPFFLAGEKRFCSALVRALPFGIYPKNGAEGVYALGIPGRNLGIAIKVADGNERGYQPVIVDLLCHLGVLPAGDLPKALRAFHRLPVHNTQKVQVGEVTSAVNW